MYRQNGETLRLRPVDTKLVYRDEHAHGAKKHRAPPQSPHLKKEEVLALTSEVRKRVYILVREKLRNRREFLFEEEYVIRIRFEVLSCLKRERYEYAKSGQFTKIVQTQIEQAIKAVIKEKTKGAILSVDSFQEVLNALKKYFSGSQRYFTYMLQQLKKVGITTPEQLLEFYQKLRAMCPLGKTTISVPDFESKYGGKSFPKKVSEGSLNCIGDFLVYFGKIPKPDQIVFTTVERRTREQSRQRYANRKIKRGARAPRARVQCP